MDPAIPKVTTESRRIERFDRLTGRTARNPARAEAAIQGGIY